MLYDLSGKKVIEQSIDNTVTLKMNELEVGLYVLKLQHNETIKTFKLLKQ